MFEVIDREKRTLYSGEENNFYDFVINLKENEVNERFSLVDIHNNYLGHLSRRIPQEDFKNLLDQANIKLNGLGLYIGKDDLSVKYFFNEKCLILVSSGETFRGNFKVYLEGIWKVRK